MNSLLLGRVPNHYRVDSFACGECLACRQDATRPVQRASLAFRAFINFPFNPCIGFIYAARHFDIASKCKTSTLAWGHRIIGLIDAFPPLSYIAAMIEYLIVYQKQVSVERLVQLPDRYSVVALNEFLKGLKAHGLYRVDDGQALIPTIELKEAIRSKQRDIVHFLCETLSYVSDEAVEGVGETSGGLVTVFEQLVDLGLDPNALSRSRHGGSGNKDKGHHISFLMAMACRTEQYALIERVLAKGAKIGRQSSCSMTVLNDILSLLRPEDSDEKKQAVLNKFFFLLDALEAEAVILYPNDSSAQENYIKAVLEKQPKRTYPDGIPYLTLVDEWSFRIGCVATCSEADLPPLCDMILERIEDDLDNPTTISFLCTGMFCWLLKKLKERQKTRNEGATAKDEADCSKKLESYLFKFLVKIVPDPDAKVYKMLLPEVIQANNDELLIVFINMLAAYQIGNTEVKFFYDRSYTTNPTHLLYDLYARTTGCHNMGCFRLLIEQVIAEAGEDNKKECKELFLPLSLQAFLQ